MCFAALNSPGSASILDRSTGSVGEGVPLSGEYYTFISLTCGRARQKSVVYGCTLHDVLIKNEQQITTADGSRRPRTSCLRHSQVAKVVPETEVFSA